MLAITGSEDGTLTVFDIETGRLRWKAELGWGLKSAGPAFSPDGKTVIVERGGVLRFFEADSGRERFGTPEAHQGGVSVVRYTPDGRAILTAGDDGTVRRWDATNGRQLGVISQVGRVYGLAVSSDGRSLATIGQLPDPSVSVWNLATGQLRRKWPKRGDLTGAEALAFSADGDAVLAYGRDGTLAVCEIATGHKRAAVQPRLSLKDRAGFYAWAVSADFAPGNRFLAVKTIGTAIVADLTSGAERFSVPCHAMAFAPDGRILAVATPGQPEKQALANGMMWSAGPIAEAITLVDLDSGKSRRIEIPKDPVVALAISPDGKLVAVAGGCANRRSASTRRTRNARSKRSHCRRR